MNGLGAAAYVWGLATLIQRIANLHHDTPDNLTGTIAAFSLFVFSAAVMGFFFVYHPVELLVEGRRKDAMVFFLTTLGTFGILTALVISMVVS